MVQNGPNDHFGQNDLIQNQILAFARPKWTKMVHFGPFKVHFGPPTVLWPFLNLSWWNPEGRDWNVQARLNSSSEIVRGPQMGGQSDPSCVEFGVFGAPRSSAQRSQKFQNSLKIGIWGPLDWKSGRPKNAKSYHDGSDPPFAALWDWKFQARLNFFNRWALEGF